MGFVHVVLRLWNARCVETAFWTNPLIGGLEKGGYCINCLIRLQWQSQQRMGKCPQRPMDFGEHRAHTSRQGVKILYMGVYSIPTPLLEPMNHMATTQRLLVQREKSVTA